MNNTIMLQEIKSQPEKLKACFAKNKDVISLLAKTIKTFSPNNIVLVGRGTSLNSIYFAKELLEIYYNVPVSIANPSVFTVYDSTLDLNKSLVIAISQSGKGKDIFKVVEKANKAGALTVAITNEKDSILAKESKYNLYNEVDKAVSYAATKTYSSTIFLLTKLIFEISNVPELDLDDNSVFEAMEKSFDYYDQIKEDVKLFKNFKYANCITRGYTIALAEELALKLKEACHFPATAYKSSEFYHGPIVIVNKNIPSFIFAIEEKTNINNIKLIEDLQKLDGFTYTITNKGEIRELSKNGIYISESNDLLAMFTAIGVLQLIVCELSYSLGYNPDFMKVLEHIDTI